jgi:hypothetical protein
MREEDWKSKGVETPANETTIGERRFWYNGNNLLNDFGRKRIHIGRKNEKSKLKTQAEEIWFLSYILLCQWLLVRT